MHTKSKRNSIVVLLGSRKRDNCVLITEGSDRECYHGNKMLYTLELLSSSFISVPILT